jgi:hypothetical protein
MQLEFNHIKSNQMKDYIYSTNMYPDFISRAPLSFRFHDCPGLFYLNYTLPTRVSLQISIGEESLKVNPIVHAVPFAICEIFGRDGLHWQTGYSYPRVFLLCYSLCDLDMAKCGARVESFSTVVCLFVAAMQTVYGLSLCRYDFPRLAFIADIHCSKLYIQFT